MKNIIFDGDGMAIHSPETFNDWYQRENNLSGEARNKFFAGPFQDCLVGKADLKKVIVPFLEKVKWNDSVDSFLDAWFKFEDRVDDKMVEKIKKLKSEGVKCYLATNQEKYRTDYIKYEMGFEKIFDKIYSSTEVGFKKPEREFFQFILNDLGINEPSSIMFWDDDEKNVLAAKEVGLDSHFYKNIDDFLEKISARGGFA